MSTTFPVKANALTLDEIERGVNTGRYDEARAACEAWHKGQPEALSTIDGAQVAELLGQIAEQQGYFADALKQYDLALQLYTQHDHVHGQARTHYGSATIYRRMGQTNLSFEQVAILSKLAERGDDALLKFYAVRAHAASLAANDKIDEAQELMERAIMLAAKSNDTRAIALSYTGLIGVLVNQVEKASAQNKPELAARHLEKLVQFTKVNIGFCEEAGFAMLHCTTLNNLASAFNTVGRVADSLPIIERQLALAERIQSRAQTAWALANVAEAALLQGDIARAKKTHAEALDIALSFGEIPLVTGIMHRLITLHKNDGEWKVALDYFEKFHQYKMRSSRAYADTQIKVLELELDSARTRAAAAKHEAQLAELAMQAMQLTTKAEQDALTGLVNRHGFERLASAAMARLASNGGKLSMAMIDLDNLKPINDQYSHLAGDEALKHVAASINAHSRKTDIAVRLGGDEFLIVFDGLNAAEAKLVCQRLQRSLEQPSTSKQFPVKVTVSIGIADTNVATSLENLLARADTALYGAKAMGRNRIELAQLPH